jgi:hypothetical protein
MICPECGTRLPEGSTKCHFCGTEISLKTETSVIDKFIALFTVWAFFIAVSIWFYTILDGVSQRSNISIIGGILVTGFYVAISPWTIKTIIDPILKK